MSVLRAQSKSPVWWVLVDKPNWTFAYLGSRLASDWQNQAMAQQMKFHLAAVTADAEEV